ncbi:MAG TPA: helix-turn-helix domain-containing protein [Candidatus Thermoplasmatota archaeon]|nr:helix-turn-helix domain-containing protein [Candidatus Thermoplasmatota archaeon]
MHLSDVAALLQGTLGLSAGEARAYAHLCVSGPSTASELAEALQLHRNEIYRVGQRLLAMQLAGAGIERPTRYNALPPALVFGERIQRLHAEADALRAAEREVERMLAAVGRARHGDHEASYRVVRGTVEIHKVCARLIAAATARIDWVSTRRGALGRVASAGGMERVLGRAEDAGMRVRLAFRADTLRERVDLAELAATPGFDVRAAPDEASLELLITDGREVVLWAVDGSGEDERACAEVAIHATAPALVAAQQLCVDLVHARALRLPRLRAGGAMARGGRPLRSAPRPLARTQA